MKIISKILIVFILGLILFLSYLSLIGFETKKFNETIIKNVKNINSNLNLELKEIKIILNLFEGKLNAKTIGSKLSSENKSIEIESIKTQIPLRSLFKEKFLIDNMEISTRSLNIKDLISFIRIFNKDPELYILNKIIKKGFLIADIKLDFDEKGKIKNNYKINGLIRDAKIDILKNYNIEKLNFGFNYNENELKLFDTNLSLNNSKLFSKNLKFTKIDENFLVNGEMETRDLELENKNIELFIKFYFPYLKVDKLKFSSKNDFTFKINNKYQFKDLSIKSDIELKEFSFLNNDKLGIFFPKINENIKLSNHKLNVNYEKKTLTINGSGDILLQNNKDQLKYLINKTDKSYNFKNTLIINNNPLVLDFLNFEKDEKEKMEINLRGKGELEKKLEIDLLSAQVGNNQFKIGNLEFDKDFKITNFSNIHINYFDRDNFLNKFSITLKDKDYLLIGSSFNINHLIDNLINNDNKKLDIFKKDFKIKIKIDELFLDKLNSLYEFTGILMFNNNEIVNGDFLGNFSNKEKLKFTIKSNKNEKITTLFLDRAKPIVQRYKFIKGFSEGKLDFYSIKKNKESVSKIKIYNFKLKELPVLTKLLTLASLQGIADLLNGEGIGFDEFEMNFKNKNNLMTIDEIYAIGPALSIMMNGYVEKDKLISLKGTLVPATTINKAIGTIPVLGQILVGSKTGEGVFGVSFKIKGPPKNLETTVNPIQTLTPRFITRTLEKIKKTN